MADDPITSVKGEKSTARLATTSDTEIRPCGHKIGGRNLIVCIDGTANQFGEKNTNVIELYNRILKETGNQKTWYNSGIGTYARPSWKSLKYYRQVVSHKIDLAIAWNFERTVLGAYRWLSDNYEPGDCIFLFGFSRGAYQVRVLSAMIDKVGLIHKGNEMQIPFAYELYVDPNSDVVSSSVTQVGSPQTKQETSSAERFKWAFSYKDVRVHFLGAWDTVSSIGIARGQKMLPRTVDGMKHVCFFRHALALDERRVKFLPEYAYGGSATCSNPDDENHSSANRGSSEKGNKPSTINEGEITEDISSRGEVGRSQGMNKVTVKHPQTLEVWFAGTHSDIGGGNVENRGMDRSRPPLRWMVLQAGALGLRTEPFERELFPQEQINVIESLTWVWWPLELCFFDRLTYSRRNDGKKTTHRPHLGSSRKIHPNQKIHGSLLLAGKLKSEYTPKAHPFDDHPSFWETAREKGLGNWLELDLDDFVRTHVDKFMTDNDSTLWQILRHTATWADGRQAVYDQVIDVLKKPVLEPEITFQLLHNTVAILRGHRANLKLSLSIEIPLVADLRHSHEKRYRETAQQFMEQFTDPSIFVLSGHTEKITSVTFSPDGRRIVSGSLDGTIRIWDAGTGKPMGEPFQGHTARIRFVAFLPDGRRLVSGSYDEPIRIWDAETGKPVGEPFQGYTGYVNSVAFSPDGRRVVCSADMTIRIWDAETGNLVGEPFQGHTDCIGSVAFSPDCRRVVSGSDDYTIRIWDAEMGKPVGEPFQGHTDEVTSVAFSPDGRHVVSGSHDKTIRIWDAETGKPVGEPFQGHTSWIRSVRFSPDGRRVVSGSDDETIRIWDAETGEPVGEPFQGHTDTIYSVAFSPDGRRIVSGSFDKTIRIWDAETRMPVGQPFLGPTDPITSVALSDSRRVFSGSGNNTVTIQDLGTEQIVARVDLNTNPI